MLSPAQIPLLKEVFDLRPGEVLDVTRAVEQADLRAKAIDRRNGGK
jgi:citrate lyase beta subunit